MTNKKDNHAYENIVSVIREAMGLTTTELSELANVDYFVVYRAEKGKKIRSDKLQKIAKALNVPDDILHYSIGEFPINKVELVKKDPIGFKRLIDAFCGTPCNLDATEKYINNLKEKISDQKKKLNPVINDIISELKTQ